MFNGGYCGRWRVPGEGESEFYFRLISGSGSRGNKQSEVSAWKGNPSVRDVNFHRDTLSHAIQKNASRLLTTGCNGLW